MIINWYPGHMKKTKELIQNSLKLVDVVIELLDARIPISSKNPDIDKLIGNKPKVIILNKSDLSDSKVLQSWIYHYANQAIKAIPVNSITGEGMGNLIDAIKDSVKDKIEAMRNKGRKIRPIRVMIVGVPNVGKSSLINKLAGKKTAKTGNKPGVTRGKQWIRIRKDLELFDTPGILWPKIEDEEVGLNLAFTGAVKDEILDMEELCLKLLQKLSSSYGDYLINRYKLDELSDDQVINMESIGKKRGCIRSRGQIDYTKVSKIVLDEFRKGIIGRITLETPDDIDSREKAEDDK